MCCWLWMGGVGTALLLNAPLPRFLFSPVRSAGLLSIAPVLVMLGGIWLRRRRGQDLEMVGAEGGRSIHKWVAALLGGISFVLPILLFFGMRFLTAVMVMMAEEFN